jgi:hypothetical protein
VGHKEMKVKEIILKPELTHLDKLLLKEPKRRDNSQDRENLPEKLRHKDKKFRENSQNRGDQVDKMSRKKLKNSRVIPKTDWVLQQLLHKEPTIKGKIFL